MGIHFGHHGQFGIFRWEKPQTCVATGCLMMSLLIMGCQTFERSPESGYGFTQQNAGQSNSSNQSLENQKMAAELGLRPGQPLSAEQWQQVQQKQHLRMMEQNLPTKREKEQYSKILPWFENDQEKVEFLSIPTIEGRQAWINSKNIWSRTSAKAQQYQSAVETADVTLGMPMDLVKKSWGEPQSVEVSGNPLYQNQRWNYLKYISSPDGYRQEKRIVYFEGGKVVGWETQ